MQFYTLRYSMNCFYLIIGVCLIHLVKSRFRNFLIVVEKSLYKI